MKTHGACGVWGTGSRITQTPFSFSSGSSSFASKSPAVGKQRYTSYRCSLKSQRIWKREAFPTTLTHILLLRVDPTVALQGGPVGRLHPADCTRVRLLPGVDALVVSLVGEL